MVEPAELPKETQNLAMAGMNCAQSLLSLQQTPVRRINTTRIVRAWQERWWIGDVGTDGDKLLHARFVRKYGGLKWFDPDNEFSTRTAHPEMMCFEKKRGKDR